MPRVIFRTLGERLAADRGAYAYIEDITESGDHYWAFCQVIPTCGTNGGRVGYLMLRRAPDRAALRVIVPIYEKLRAIEKDAPDRATGAKLSRQAFDAFLADLGQTYEEFIFSRAT